MKPVLLLIPGMLNTAAVWSCVAPLLDDAADLRIADVTTQDSIARMADDAWALVADVPAETPLFVCGFSMGGYVALQMLAEPQRMPAGLCLLCTSARPETPEGAAVRDKTIAAIGRSFEKVVETVLMLGSHPDTQADTERMHALRALMLGVGPDAAVRQNLAVKTRADQRPLLPQLALPVRVVTSRDDRIVPPAAGEELAAAIPGAQLAWLQGVGHMAPMEQPEQVAAQLRALLND